MCSLYAHARTFFVLCLMPCVFAHIINVDGNNIVMQRGRIMK